MLGLSPVVQFKDERVRAYVESPSLVLPAQHSREQIAIDEFTGYCKNCEKPCVELRGEVVEWPGSLQLRAGGRCEPCKLVTFFEMRWYGAGHVLHRSSHGWVLYPHLTRLQELAARVRQAVSNRFRSA